MDVVWIVRDNGGIATRGQILGAGVPPAAITAAVKSGSLLRVRRAWYATPDTPFDHRIAVALGGRLGGISAARSYGLWVPDDNDIHVSWPPHGNVARLGHRIGFPNTHEISGRRIVSHWRILREARAPRESWRESLEQSLAQVLLTSERRFAIAVVDSALHTGQLTPGHPRSAFGRMPHRVQSLLELSNGDSDSGLESMMRLWLSDQSLPYLVHPQLCGLEVDLLVGDSLIIELDGRTFHSGPEAFEADRHRDNLLESSGCIVVRFSYRQVMYEWDACVARIRHHLLRGDHRRPIAV